MMMETFGPPPSVMAFCASHRMEPFSTTQRKMACRATPFFVLPKAIQGQIKEPCGPALRRGLYVLATVVFVYLLGPTVYLRNGCAPLARRLTAACGWRASTSA